MNESLVGIKAAIAAFFTAVAAFLGWKGIMAVVWVVAIICQHLPLGIDWPAIILPLVLAWYIITELGSILENAVKLGATVPSWLTKLLKASLKAVQTMGDGADAQPPEKKE